MGSSLLMTFARASTFAISLIFTPWLKCRWKLLSLNMENTQKGEEELVCHTLNVLLQHFIQPNQRQKVFLFISIKTIWQRTLKDVPFFLLVLICFYSLESMWHFDCSKTTNGCLKGNNLDVLKCPASNFRVS